MFFYDDGENKRETFAVSPFSIKTVVHAVTLYCGLVY